MKPEEQRVSVLLDALPSGWAKASIGETIAYDGLFVDGDWVESKDQDPKGDVRLIQLADVGDGVYRNRSNRFLTYEKALQLGCSFLQPNDILIARMPDPLGRACLFPGDSKPSVTVVDVCIVRTGANGLTHKWLMYSIDSPAFRVVIAGLQSGSTRKRISRGNLSKIHFPLPPLPEQNRIVAKLEELFTRMDAGIEALKKIQVQLKRYRQSVLKSAFSGELTAEWRNAHKGELEPASALLEKIKEERKKSSKYKELPPLDTSELPALPDGWVWSRLGNVSEIMMVQSPPGESYNLQSIGTPLINGPVEFGGSPFSRTMKRQFTTKAKKMCKENDLILCVRGSTTGRMNIAGFDGCIGRGVAAIRALIHQGYLNYFVHSMQRSIYELGTGSTFPNVTTVTVGNIKVPVPSYNEQEYIIEILEQYLSVADKIENAIEQSIKQSNRLRQSILKKAFEGKLVPQNPDDEPAEKLLERIKIERAKTKIHSI